MSDPTTTPAARDTITIKNLQLPHGLLAPDVWGNLKEQPALISITLHLHGNGFNTAANQDALDVSTIHYGQLAKLIRSNSVPDSTPSTLDTQIAQSITAMATKSTGNFIVAESIVEINLPKASMYGDAGISIITSTSFTTSGTETSSKQTFSIKDVKIMTLLGVNTYERTANQPLLASLNVYIQGSRDTAKLFGLERHLVETIATTHFATLETLAEYTISRLREQVLDAEAPGCRIHLKLEKPRAIAWAEAPGVEIVRDIP